MADKEEYVSTILLRMTPDLHEFPKRCDPKRNPTALLRKHIYRMLKPMMRPEVSKEEQAQGVYDWANTVSPKTDAEPINILCYDEIREILARKAVRAVKEFRFPAFRPAFRQYMLAVLEMGETEPPLRYNRFAIPEGVRGVMRYWLRRGLKEWLNGWA